MAQLSLVQTLKASTAASPMFILVKSKEFTVLDE